MSREFPSVTDIITMLAGTQHAYAQACEHVQDPFNKHIMRQLALKRNRPIVELNRVLVMNGGDLTSAARGGDHAADGLVFQQPTTDRGILGYLEYREQLTAVMYGETLRDRRVTSGIRALLQQHLREISTILVILGEALRSGGQRAA